MEQRHVDAERAEAIAGLPVAVLVAAGVSGSVGDAVGAERPEEDADVLDVVAAAVRLAMRRTSTLCDVRSKPVSM